MFKICNFSKSFFPAAGNKCECRISAEEAAWAQNPVLNIKQAGLLLWEKFRPRQKKTKRRKTKTKTKTNTKMRSLGFNGF